MTDTPAAGAHLHPLPVQLDGVPWPRAEWPTAPVPDGVDIEALMEAAFDPDGPLRDTYAVVCIHQGRLVFERYGGTLPRLDGPGRLVTPSTPLLSWSVAKSFLHVVVGMLVGDGVLDPASRADVPEWSGGEDPRRDITLADLLAMRDGLAYAEEYEDPEASDVIQMLFGRGQSDMAAFAADRPLAASPSCATMPPRCLAPHFSAFSHRSSSSRSRRGCKTMSMMRAGDGCSRCATFARRPVPCSAWR